MNAKRLPGSSRRSSPRFRFDLATSRAMQEAERYSVLTDALRFLSGSASCAVIVAGTISAFHLSEWQREHEWNQSVILRGLVLGLSFLLSLFLALFGVPGILAQFTKRRFGVSRSQFLMISGVLLLPALFLREKFCVNAIEGFAFTHFLTSTAARWADNQRPADWKTIIAEKKRLNWGPLEFVSAMIEGCASDGKRLAYVASSGELDLDDHFSPIDGNERSIRYQQSSSILTLTLRQRYRHFQSATVQLALLESDGCSSEERQQMEREFLYVHSEIADRVNSLFRSWEGF
jgi:hypothetical protein